MTYIVGSARIDENGNISGGAAGDQTGKEVSTQNFYVHKKGWVVLRAVDPAVAEKLADAMLKYCNDNNVGYDQSNRSAIMKYNGTGKTECDCSSLVRRCIKDATGKDVGNIRTVSMRKILINSGLFFEAGEYDQTKTCAIMTGDILVTKTSGHTVICITAGKRPKIEFYVGSTYHTTCNLYCRCQPSKESKAVKIYPAGTRVTCKNIKYDYGNIWMQTPDGWSAAYYNGKVRIK